MAEIFKRKKHLSTFQIITVGFAAVILLGALILMLPISSRAGEYTPFGDTLFTATSAVCVTGQIVRDTGSYWSSFGHAVILTLIQIGGLGVVTVAAAFALLRGKKISLSQRSTLVDAISADKVGGIVKFIKFILIGTFAVELVGALALMPTFCGEFGARGVWYAFFHSISAFCNAGFDILGTDDAQYGSITRYADSPTVNITVMLLIIIGGIGFLVWRDICTHKFRLGRYSMQSKVVLTTSLLLILLPAVIFFFTDFSGENIGDGILAALFQSVTTRTAGFNTVDLNTMSSASRGIMIVLMLIGGSPGSTAGGMKTTTLAVLLSNIGSVFRRKEDAEMFGRRIDSATVKTASAIALMYFTLFFGGAVTISIIEQLSLTVCLFETASTTGTVGLTLGITPTLGTVSRLILILQMFLGRVGGLTLIYAALMNPSKNLSKYPIERITVG